MDDDKKIFLERQWQLLDGNKKLRAHIPTITSSLNIVIGSFYFKSINELKDSNLWFAFIVTLISIFGYLALKIIQEQYKYSNLKIEHLYKKFDINYLSDFDGKLNGTKLRVEYETGEHLFKIGYRSIILIGILVVFGILCLKQSTCT